VGRQGTKIQQNGSEEMNNEIAPIMALIIWALMAVNLAKRKPLFDEPEENDGNNISWLKIPVGESIQFELKMVVFTTVAAVRDCLGFAVPPKANEDARAAILYLGKGHGIKFGEWEVGGQFLTLSPGLIRDLLLTVYGKDGASWEVNTDNDEYDEWTPIGGLSSRFEIVHVDEDGSRSAYTGRLI